MIELSVECYQGAPPVLQSSRRVECPVCQNTIRWQQPAEQRMPIRPLNIAQQKILRTSARAKRMLFSDATFSRDATNSHPKIHRPVADERDSVSFHRPVLYCQIRVIIQLRKWY